MYVSFNCKENFYLNSLTLRVAIISRDGIIEVQFVQRPLVCFFFHCAVKKIKDIAGKWIDRNYIWCNFEDSRQLNSKIYLRGVKHWQGCRNTFLHGQFNSKKGIILLGFLSYIRFRWQIPSKVPLCRPSSPVIRPLLLIAAKTKLI